MSVNSLPSMQQELGFYAGDNGNIDGTGIDRLYGPALTSHSEVEQLLQRVASILEVSKLSVAASQFTKWYCRAHIAVLYEFSIEQAARSASLRDISVLFPGSPPFAVACNGKTVPVTDEAAREPLRELTVVRLFAHNWNLVFKSLCAVTGIRENILWENGSMYIHYFYRLWIEAAKDENQRSQLQSDYEYIIQQAPPELFGELQCFNPFGWTGQPVRSTCCLRYHLPDGKYCSVCPVSHAKTNM